MIKFHPENHEYISVDQDQIDWIGVSSFIHAFQPGFNPVSGSVKASRNPKSKWFGMDPDLIQKIWKNESNRSLSMGSWYHNIQEDKITADDTYQGFRVIKPILKENIKYAPNQRLEEGNIYPEHMVYLQSLGLCGQSDRVEVKDFKVSVRDYKTSKVIKQEGFRSWEGVTQRMLDPISHLDDCNMVHYTLQMSLYLYIILKHNPQLSPGTLTLDHIIFEQESEDKYGYPIYKTDDQDNFIIKEVKPYIIPYLKTEVISLLNYLKDNREEVKSRISKNHD